jgi:hypothetical protein
MDKKYQVFVSSTYTDLIDERQAALRAVVTLGHIATGMEGFVASDQAQFEYIKRIIDQCDYYVLIIAGRYGSLHHSGVSFTEMEYDYAVSKGITVLAFLHKNTSTLPSGKVDSDPAMVAQLGAFVARVKQDRMVSFWQDQGELQLAITASLSQAIHDFPGIGWVRGNAAASEDILTQLNHVRITLEQTQQDNEFLRNQFRPHVDNIAPLTGNYLIEYYYFPKGSGRRNASIILSWDTIFTVIGPSFYSPKQQTTMDYALKQYIRAKDGITGEPYIAMTYLDQIKIQLAAYGFLDIYSAETTQGGMGEFIRLTEYGKKALVELMAIRSA